MLWLWMKVKLVLQDDFRVRVIGLEIESSCLEVFTHSGMISL